MRHSPMTPTAIDASVPDTTKPFLLYYGLDFDTGVLGHGVIRPWL
jgi:hypothetical protein